MFERWLDVLCRNTQWQYCPRNPFTLHWIHPSRYGSRVYNDIQNFHSCIRITLKRTVDYMVKHFVIGYVFLSKNLEHRACQNAWDAMHYTPIRIIQQHPETLRRQKKWAWGALEAISHCQCAVYKFAPQAILKVWYIMMMVVVMVVMMMMMMMMMLSWRQRRIHFRQNDISVNESYQHWFKQWTVAYSAPRHYLNKCLNIVDWTLRNKLQ